MNTVRCELLGVRIAAGVLWLAGSTPDGSFVDDRTDRLTFADTSLAEGRALAELQESLQAVLARLGARRVALLNTGTSGRTPKQNVMLRRGALEAAVALAAHNETLHLSRITHEAVEKAVGVRPTDKALSNLLAERLDGDPPACWADRAPAFAAALTDLDQAA